VGARSHERDNKGCVRACSSLSFSFVCSVFRVISLSCSHTCACAHPLSRMHTQLAFMLARFLGFTLSEFGFEHASARHSATKLLWAGLNRYGRVPPRCRNWALSGTNQSLRIHKEIQNRGKTLFLSIVHKYCPTRLIEFSGALAFFTMLTVSKFGREISAFLNVQR